LIACTAILISACKKDPVPDFKTPENTDQSLAAVAAVSTVSRYNHSRVSAFSWLCDGIGNSVRFVYPDGIDVTDDAPFILRILLITQSVKYPFLCGVNCKDP